MWELPKERCEHEKCFNKVGDKTAAWSKRKYGKVLCFEHVPVTMKDVVKRYQFK